MDWETSIFIPISCSSFCYTASIDNITSSIVQLIHCRKTNIFVNICWNGRFMLRWEDNNLNRVSWRSGRGNQVGGRCYILLLLHKAHAAIALSPDGPRHSFTLIKYLYCAFSSWLKKKTPTSSNCFRMIKTMKTRNETRMWNITRDAVGVDITDGSHN